MTRPVLQNILRLIKENGRGEFDIIDAYGVRACKQTQYNIPFVHKSLQYYNDFVWTVTRLNGYMNYSLKAVGLPLKAVGLPLN